MGNFLNTKRIIPLATAAVGVLFVVTGISKYGFWTAGKGPTPGFFPILVAALMIGVSVLAFIQSLKEEKPVFPRENTMVILAGAGIFVATFIIGLVPAAAVYVLLWLKVYEKCSWKQTLMVFAVIMAIVIGVFVIWLKVPFPQGILLESLLS